MGRNLWGLFVGMWLGAALVHAYYAEESAFTLVLIGVYIMFAIRYVKEGR